MTIEEYLKPYREEEPKWLSEYKPGDNISFRDVMSSRVVYYPGALFDGQPVKTFNKAHYAHVFLYADYMVSRKRFLDELKYDGFRGYHLLQNIPIKEREITPSGWTAHIKKLPVNSGRYCPNEIPFCEVSIFERDSTRADDWGNERFVLIYLCADGIATYDALFGNKNYQVNTLVLQDHGFGGNYNCFGNGGLMNEIASATGVFPEYILCAENTDNWHGFEGIPDVEPVIGGMHGTCRYLCRKKNDK